MTIITTNKCYYYVRLVLVYITNDSTGLTEAVKH